MPCSMRQKACRHHVGRSAAPSVVRRVGQLRRRPKQQWRAPKSTPYRRIHQTYSAREGYMFLRALTAIAAVGPLTTIATAPAISGPKQIGSTFTLSHQPPDRRVQSGKDHKNWVNVQSMNLGSRKPGGGATADEAPSFGWT